MSLLHNPIIIPPPRDRVAELERENDSLKAQVRELNIKLLREQERSDMAMGGAERLRGVLHPLYSALQRVFGDLDNMGIEGSTPASEPRNKAVWESWKQKLGGQTADAINVLLLHGEMNAEQLRIHLRCARTHVYNVISRLNKAGIINKNGGRISLKEL